MVDVQGSKGVVLKAKPKLKPLRDIGQERGAEVASTQGIVTLNPILEDKNDPY